MIAIPTARWGNPESSLSGRPSRVRFGVLGFEGDQRISQQSGLSLKR
jgi:hypothetical protein